MLILIFLIWTTNNNSNNNNNNNTATHSSVVAQAARYNVNLIAQNDENHENGTGTGTAAGIRIGAKNNSRKTVYNKKTKLN